MELLCKLNEEEGITCIMVTHDPNLKNVATKVVQMRDGKVAKIELVVPKETSKARQNIRDQIVSKRLIIDLGRVKRSKKDSKYNSTKYK